MPLKIVNFEEIGDESTQNHGNDGSKHIFSKNIAALFARIRKLSTFAPG